MPNVFDPDFDEPRDQPGFECKRARLGHQAGSRDLGASLWELEPGKAAYPYHWHMAEEELILVLEGRPSLRDPDGWRELEEGEIVSFPVGEGGGHQLVNRTDTRVRFLSISTLVYPEVCVYPDSDKVGVYHGPGRGRLFRRSDSVGYWEGESPPG